MKLTEGRTWLDAVLLGVVIVMFETWRQNICEEKKLTKVLMVYFSYNLVAYYY